MHDHIQRRRAAAQSVRVAHKHLHNGRPPLSLMDPMFNMREIVKQLLLLEDHLLHRDRRCSDCIRKHLLTAEALADEAEALDETGIHETTCGKLTELFKVWAGELIDGGNPRDIGQSVRALRKNLTPLVFDPRGEYGVQRVAAVHLDRIRHI